MCGDKLDESMRKYQRTQHDMDRLLIRHPNRLRTMLKLEEHELILCDEEEDP